MIRVIEIESSLSKPYKRGSRIEKGAFLGLTPDLSSAVFSPFTGRIISMTLSTEKQVVSIEIEESEDANIS